MSGFVAKRRGVLDHLQGGRLTLLEYGAYDAIILLADKASGVWFGSARALAANCGAGDVAERQARRILESLETKGYIRRFPVRRSHRNYPILIDKYQVTFGAYTGMRLNAAATSDWRTPVYEKGPEQGAQHGAEHAPIREGHLRRRQEKTTSASAQAPSQEAIALASLLKGKILANLPTFRITDTQEHNWAREADLMLQRDRRTGPQIRELIEWAQKDPFWRTNILSMGKLRKNFDQLSLKKQGNGNGEANREPEWARREHVHEQEMLESLTRLG